jgi:hypothetical protein
MGHVKASHTPQQLAALLEEFKAEAETRLSIFQM